MGDADHAAQRATLRVLAIDDNPADLKLLATTFDAIGISVDLRTATDGRDAVELLQGELLREHGWRPDLMIVDLSMPHIDGLETVARLRGNRALAKVPLAVLSGSIHPADRTRSLAAGANCYLIKPGNFEGLVALVKDLVAGLPPRQADAGHAGR